MEHVILYSGFAVAGWLLLIGLYGIVTSTHLVHLCLCLAVVQASTYVLLTVIGYRPGLPAPVFVDHVRPGSPAVDPVVQALMLTDIVVEATVVALLLAITVQLHKKTGSADPNHVNLMRG
ncbi:MAG TPA: cation:proton antiporter subunit C [Tepidisphaeraceae bacterium]|nr:cation:proton antiporter subunit C [Tepidisphaeraceae bacterium]